VREVARFSDVYEAELAVSFLASHGVLAVVADRGLATVDPVLQSALGGIRVLTTPTQAQAARELLMRASRGEFADHPAEARTEASADGLFAVVTALAGLLIGNGYSGRPFVGARRRLGGVQILGLILLCALIATAAGPLIAAAFATAFPTVRP
jgi:hypothetical protein